MTPDAHSRPGSPSEAEEGHLREPGFVRPARPSVGSRRPSKTSPGRGLGPPPKSTVRSVARHVDAHNLHDGVLVAFGSACVVGVELVVDATCAGYLVVVHIGPAFLALHVSAFEAGDAAQKRQLIRSVSEVIPELLDVLVPGLGNGVLPLLPHALGHEDTESGFGDWLSAGAGDGDVWVVCPNGWPLHTAGSLAISVGEETSTSSSSTPALTRAMATGSRNRSLVRRQAWMVLSRRATERSARALARPSANSARNSARSSSSRAVAQASSPKSVDRRSSRARLMAFSSERKARAWSRSSTRAFKSRSGSATSVSPSLLRRRATPTRASSMKSRRFAVVRSVGW